MVSSLAFMLATTLAATPCESLKSVPLPDTTITAAELVPEGPAPQRGGGGARGALRVAVRHRLQVAALSQRNRPRRFPRTAA